MSGRLRQYRQDRGNGRPPWWRWFEPPRWWPRRAHLACCTFCREMAAYARELERAERGNR